MCQAHVEKICNSLQVGGSSDEEEEDKNVWVITKEQYSYYVTQFKAMQANPRGVIPGTQVNSILSSPLLSHLDCSNRQKSSLKSLACQFKNFVRYGSYLM